MATIQITVTTRVGVSVDSSPKPLLRDDGKTKISGLLVVGDHLVFAKDIIAGSAAQTVVNPVVTFTHLADQDSLFLSDDKSQLKFVDTDGNRHAVRIDGDAQVGLVLVDGFEGEEQIEEEQEPEPETPRRQARQAKPAAPAGRGRRAAPEPEPEFDEGDPEADDELYEGDDPEGDEEDFDDQGDPEGDFPDDEGDDPEGDDPEGDDGEPLFDGDELADIVEEPAPRRQAARAPAKPQGRQAQRQPAGKPAQRRPARQQDADDFDLNDIL